MPDSTTTVNKPPVAAARPNGLEALRRYFRESRIELRKVTWPSREQTVNLTIVVVVVCIALALFLGAIDYVFVQLITKLSST
jgi:preprotein translocase subunit SecE